MWNIRIPWRKLSLSTEFVYCFIWMLFGRHYYYSTLEYVVCYLISEKFFVLIKNNFFIILTINYHLLISICSCKNISKTSLIEIQFFFIFQRWLILILIICKHKIRQKECYWRWKPSFGKNVWNIYTFQM